ncbi:glutathione S-transferase [Bordetella sp. N]|nr:glutathione S-transferase [Bordetella sp. N]
MRARLALSASGQRCELREVVLRNKPMELLQASPKGTVPVLVLLDGRVIDQSLDIMHWALAQSDPAKWLVPERESKESMDALIALCDGPFKTHLDRYKYPDRYPGADSLEHRTQGVEYLLALDARLSQNAYLFGSAPCLADMAIAPFVRQFAATDATWFENQPWSALRRWLNAFTESERFEGIMEKYAPWISGAPGVVFPGAGAAVSIRPDR